MDVQSIELMWLTGAFLLGLLNCFFGYRLFMVTVAIVGFMVGASLGYITGSWLGGTILTVATALVLGMIGAWASVVAYYAFIFVVGAFGFAFLTAFVWGLYSEAGSVLFPVVAGLIGGFVALRIQRIIIIVGTAAQGARVSVFAAVAVVSGGGLWAYRNLFYRLLGGELSRPGDIWFYVAVLSWLVLFAAGSVTQFTRGKEMYKRRLPEPSAS